jgi:hypothetical protein
VSAALLRESVSNVLYKDMLTSLVVRSSICDLSIIKLPSVFPHHLKLNIEAIVLYNASLLST